MLKILIIDDNSGFRNLIREMLDESRLQFFLAEASNPLEALEEFKKHNHNFDFILCDYFMPIQNGSDFLELVKSYNKRITCFLISGDNLIEKQNLPYVDHFFEKSDPQAIIKQIELQQFLIKK